MKSRKSTLLFLLMFLVVASCSPTLYFIDRQTVMEMEAAGEWPEFDKDFFRGAIKVGTTDYVSIVDNEPRKRMYSVLNGEFESGKSNK